MSTPAERTAQQGSIHPRLVAALTKQLEQRREALARGAEHVGWKLGMGDRERIGGHLAVGHLTSATTLAEGARYAAPAGDHLHADAEIAVELGADVDPAGGAEDARAAIARYGGALELVDLAPVPGEPEAAVAGNVFHRAVAFGALRPGPAAPAEVSVWVDGACRASAGAPASVAERLAAAARLLAAVDECLRAGDRVITGSVVQVPIEPPCSVAADFGPLGRVELDVAG